MANPYSIDLRERVIECLRANKNIETVWKLYKISRATLYRWKSRYEKTGSYEPKSGYQVKPMKIKDLERFKEFIEENNDKSSEELSYLWPEEVSRRTILNTIKKIGYSYKKNFSSSQERCWYER